MSVEPNTVRKVPTKHLVVPEINAPEAVNLDNSLRQALAVRVSKVLQTTLDIETLIGLFAQQMKPAIPHDGMCYSNTVHEIESTVGQIRKNHHIRTYSLIAHGEPLGELTLSRKWDFSREEETIFEYGLYSLIYPLRNSLLYLQALQAAHKDPLTGAFNRASMDEALDREIKLAERYDRPLSMIVMDVDHFKSVNDTMGHVAGDTVLQAIVECTGTCIRSTDIVFRYGGEEFVVLLSNTDLPGAALLAERIRQRVEHHRVDGKKGESIKITLSLGVAQLQNTEDATTFFCRADKALYEAKGLGRNRVVISEHLLA